MGLWTLKTSKSTQNLADLRRKASLHQNPAKPTKDVEIVGNLLNTILSQRKLTTWFAFCREWMWDEDGICCYGGFPYSVIINGWERIWDLEKTEKCTNSWGKYKINSMTILIFHPHAFQYHLFFRFLCAMDSTSASSVPVTSTAFSVTSTASAFKFNFKHGSATITAVITVEDFPWLISEIGITTYN